MNIPAVDAAGSPPSQDPVDQNIIDRAVERGLDYETAAGDDLDRIASRVGVARLPDDTDETLRSAIRTGAVWDSRRSDNVPVRLYLARMMVIADALADQPACPTFGVGDRVRVVSLPDSQSHGSMPDAALGAFGRISMIATVRPGDPPLIAVRLYDFNGLWWFSPENLEHPPGACPFTTTPVRAGQDVAPRSVSVPEEIRETACDYCGGSGSGKIFGHCPVCRGGRCGHR